MVELNSSVVPVGLSSVDVSSVAGLVWAFIIFVVMDWVLIARGSLEGRKSRRVFLFGVVLPQVVCLLGLGVVWFVTKKVL